MKSACMVIRIFDEEAGIVRSEFYNLAELGEKADAETLFNAIESTFRKDAIPFDNLIGFASDGANAMLGRHNSVKTRLLAKQPHLFVIHCICHVAALCASHACSKAIPTEVERVANVYHSSLIFCILLMWSHIIYSILPRLAGLVYISVWLEWLNSGQLYVHILHPQMSDWWLYGEHYSALTIPF
uniref:DUF4371 domain-containing protein n=1 Tax=Amphimedon queenslandica TaxID=400682 RepID=A0A1X7TYQ7_AMPQE